MPTGLPLSRGQPTEIAFQAAKRRQIISDSGTGQKALADQQDAGRTQLIAFEVESRRYLVDLPFTGSLVPIAVKEKWQRELKNICASS